MSAFVCIMSVDGTSATKVQHVSSEADAQIHLQNHQPYTDAFYAPTPSFPEWRWVCDTVAKTISDRGPYSQAELDAMQEAEKDEQADRIFVSDEAMKAFALVVMDEVNLLRAEHSLPARTATQLRNAVKARLGG